MNMLSLFPAIPVLMMLGLWLSKSARQVRAVMVAGSSLLLALAVVLLAWSGAFGGPLTAAMELVLRGLCRVVQFPFALVEYYFF